MKRTEIFSNQCGKCWLKTSKRTKKKKNVEIPDAPTTHSEIHVTAPPSTFSNFMVKMLWLQEKAVWVFHKVETGVGPRSRRRALASCWRTGSSWWRRRSCSCSRAAGFCRPRPSSARWPTWDLERWTSRVTRPRTARPPPQGPKPTFDVSVAGAVVAHPERRPLLGLGAQRRLEQVVHQFVVDFEEGHPQREPAAAAASSRWVAGQNWREDSASCTFQNHQERKLKEHGRRK